MPNQKQRVAKWLSLACGFAIACGGCRRSTPASHLFKTPFQNEAQFVVEAIVSDLAEQIVYAKQHELPDPGSFSVHAVEQTKVKTGPTVINMVAEVDNWTNYPPEIVRYDLTVAVERKRVALKINLQLDSPIWSPDSYRTVAAALARELDLHPIARTRETENTALLDLLTDKGALRIEQENLKLSDELARDFSNPILHEEAAVLLGAFALREHSGEFYDVRGLLCRMTAHLTLAQFLSGDQPLGVNGQVARTMLSTLMNNQADALRQLDAIDARGSGVRKWIQSLRAINTGDYRPLAKLEDASLVERVAWFDAFGRSVNSDQAWENLKDDEKRMPDFCRLANANGYSVGTGHDLLDASLESEFRELASVYQLSHRQPLRREQVPDVLNVKPGRCFSDGKVNVIGWGQWAMFFQRHVCHAIQNNYIFIDKRWGVPDSAREFAASCDREFNRLTLYPFIQRWHCATADSYKRTTEAAIQLFLTHPHLVPSECACNLYKVEGKFAFAEPITSPPVDDWFSHSPLPGTAYDPEALLAHFDVLGPHLVAKLEWMHEAAPYHRAILRKLVDWDYRCNKSYPRVEALYRPLLPYAAYASKILASTVQDDPQRYEEAMLRSAELDPTRYFPLADYFRDRHQDDKAAQYYEKGIALSNDSVWGSNYADWLVRYYFAKGDLKKAAQLADWAADVYSGKGLEAKAWLLEATGDYTGAFEWYARIEERYDKSAPLIAFCSRYKAKTGDPRFDKEVLKRMGGAFPNGQEKVGLSDFKGAPSDGVLIQQENDLIHKAGLHAGSVIVAIYGTRVHNFAQYAYCRELGNRPELDLIVWQYGAYRQVKTSPPDRKFGVEFGDYPAR